MKLSRSIALALIALLCSGCTTLSGGSFCAIYEPVLWGIEDSPETIAAIDRNNAAFVVLCNPGVASVASAP